MKISVAIMAHPKRQAAAEALHRQLVEMPFYWVGIVYNEKEDGTPHEREWDTGSRCLEWGLGKGDWHIVIQDDAILTPHFYKNVESALLSLPVKSLLSFYVGQARPYPERVQSAVDRANDGDFLIHWMLLWGVGIAIPTDHIEAVLEYCEGREEPYDTRIGMFYMQNRLGVYYTLPSLVDHDDEKGSLLGHGQAPGARIAHRPATGEVLYSGRTVDL